MGSSPDRRRGRRGLAETHTFPPTFVPSQWTIEPYLSVLGQHDFLKYMSHSFVVAAVTTLWGVLVAAWSAYGFARFDFPGKWAALVFVLLAQSFPRILPIIPYFQMASAAHMVDTYPALILRTISVALNYFLGEFTTEWNNIMAAPALATLPVVIIFLFLQRQLVQGLTGGAVKG